MARATQSLEGTDATEVRILDELYPELQRFAAIVAPFDVDANDLLHEALVRTLRKLASSELADPGACLQRTMVDLAVGHGRRMGLARKSIARCYFA